MGFPIFLQNHAFCRMLQVWVQFLIQYFPPSTQSSQTHVYTVSFGVDSPLESIYSRHANLLTVYSECRYCPTSEPVYLLPSPGMLFSTYLHSYCPPLLSRAWEQAHGSQGSIVRLSGVHLMKRHTWHTCSYNIHSFLEYNWGPSGVAALGEHQFILYGLCLSPLVSTAKYYRLDSL